MKIGQAIAQTQQLLRQSGIEEGQLESEYLLAELVGLPRLRLFERRDQELPSTAETCLQGWTQERQRHKPLAYILGYQPFRDFQLKVSPAVLIPRPETEQLVELAERLLATLHDAFVVDVGTGSGNIALSLARIPQVESVMAIDISEEALGVARRNASLLNERDKIYFVQGDLLQPLLTTGESSVDVIVANLPYVKTSEMSSLQPELRWEPRIALDGGEDGLLYIRPLVRQAARLLKSSGFLLLEIGASHEEVVRNLFVQEASWASVQIHRDFAGLPRMVEAQLSANDVVADGSAEEVVAEKDKLWIY